MKHFLTLLAFSLFVIGVHCQLYNNLKRRNEYDYIIVGAGSAGATVASRLSEDPDTTVLLLEAGGVPNAESDIPLFAPKLQGTEMDWAYVTEPQEKAFLGYVEQRSLWPRGKVLGGSSVLNYMAYTRGNHRDYDSWDKMGAKGWSWKEVFPYFLKSEDQTVQDLTSSGYHQEGGLMTISDVPARTPLATAYLAAGESLGYPIIDYNGASQTGMRHIQAFLRKGTRCSTEKAFLRPAANRTNLDILIKATVIKIQFDDNKVARSVVYERNNSTHIINAKKEIILSAGAIGSPQLLMLSGVGPKDDLQKLDIPVIADLPVGENLIDHIAAGGLYFTLNESVAIVPSRDVTAEAFEEYQQGKGYLTIPAGEVTAFIKTKYADKYDDWADVQLLFASTGIIFPGLNNDIAKSLKGLEGKDSFIILPQLSRPESRGFIKLTSNSSSDRPIIQPNYLTVDQDVNVLVEGLKFVRDLVDSEPMKKFSPKQFPEKLLGCEEYESWSDEYLTCLARTYSATIYHAAGTCKMGDPSDATTVVDPQLRVKGVSNLRVVDASVVPQLPSGNPNAAIIMIAEKVSDMIRGLCYNTETKTSVKC